MTPFAPFPAIQTIGTRSRNRPFKPLLHSRFSMSDRQFRESAIGNRFRENTVQQERAARIAARFPVGRSLSGSRIDPQDTPLPGPQQRAWNVHDRTSGTIARTALIANIQSCTAA